MADKQVLLTAEGLAKLEEELDFLKTTKRKEISQQIQTARGYGDLSENSEYDEAMNEQAKVEARIADLEATLKHAKVIDAFEADSGLIQVGAKVRILDVEFDSEEEYQIVGSTEANPLNGCISDESPVGKALIGHGVGDDVFAEAPGGTIHYKVLEILR